MNKEDFIKDYALNQLGFDDIGFTSPFLKKEDLQDYYELIETNNFGKLSYLEKHLKFKEHPELLLPNVTSALVLLKGYPKLTPDLNNEPRIARYALHEDYHKVMGKKLKCLAEFLQSSFGAETYWGVDSKPIPEKSLALKAGLGFLGKNRLVINCKLGSFFSIGVIYTTLTLNHASQPIASKCNACSLCVKKCPTGALKQKDNGQTYLEIEKCLSYQTIYQQPILGWQKGCDLCQEVCPFNKVLKLY